MSRTGYIWILLLVLGVVACKIGPKYKSPDITIPECYIHLFQEEDTISIGKWWMHFNDTTLNQLVAQAIDSNQDIRTAALRIEQADKTFRIARTELWPKFNYDLSPAVGNYLGTPLESTTGMYFVGAGMSWELDFWGKFRHAADARKAEYMSTMFTHRAIQQEVVSSVVGLYIELITARQLIDISSETLDLRDSVVYIQGLKLQHGIINETDYQQAVVQRAAAASVLEFSILQGELVQHALSILIGGTPAPVSSPRATEELPEPDIVPQGIPSDLLARRPDLLAAEQQLRAMHSYTGVARAQRLPSITLTGNLGGASATLGGANLHSLAWNTGMSLLGPIWHFNKNKLNLERAILQQQEMEVQYEQFIYQAIREVEDAMVSIQQTKEQLVALDEYVSSAVRYRHLSQLRYSEGVTSYLEYLEAQRQTFNAQLEQATSQRDLLQGYVALFKALGGDWQISDVADE